MNDREKLTLVSKLKSTVFFILINSEFSSINMTVVKLLPEFHLQHNPDYPCTLLGAFASLKNAY
jgi:hypothetical protein